MARDKPEDVELVSALDHGDDEAVLQRDGDPEIDLALVQDVIAIDGGIDHFVATQAVDGDLGNERCKG